MPLTKMPALLDYSAEPNGTGINPTLCFVKDKATALEIAKHPAYRGPYSAGNRFEDDIVEREFVYIESLDEFLAWKGELKDEQVKRTALAKLSKEEIEVFKKLGLKLD